MQANTDAAIGAVQTERSKSTRTYSYAAHYEPLAKSYQDYGEVRLVALKNGRRYAALADDREDLDDCGRMSPGAYAKGWLSAPRTAAREIELRKQLAQTQVRETPVSSPMTMRRLATKIRPFYWLEKAYSEKAGSLGYIKVAKQMELLLRSDPRYIDLLKRMGLPQ